MYSRFRYARHTNDLEQLKQFYMNVLGLELLGSFEKHEKYAGIFLGLKGESWHMEFTQSDEKADHHPDPDDLCVLYVNTREELDNIRERIQSMNIRFQTPKNSYWERYGFQILDPDGYGVVIAVVP